MSDREKLIAYIEGLTPEQVDKITNRLPLLKQMLELNEWEAINEERGKHGKRTDNRQASCPFYGDGQQPEL